MPMYLSGEKRESIFINTHTHAQRKRDEQHLQEIPISKTSKVHVLKAKPQEIKPNNHGNANYQIVQSELDDK